MDRASSLEYRNSILNTNYFALKASSEQNEVEEQEQNDKRKLELDPEEKARRKRNRKSRWDGVESDKTFIPGMPTILPANMDSKQEKAYLLQLQIEHYTRTLRSGDFSVDTSRRSPSPEPIYGNDGKRVNTRDHRLRRLYEEERHKLILQMFEINPEYKPPADYKPPCNRIIDKVWIPQEDHPGVNFIGLLIGPRGTTLRDLEESSGAKIIIRGKGSVKEGKVGRKDGLPMPGEDEPLHALITAMSSDSAKKARVLIKKIIKEGVEVPEDQNDLRKHQLRQLALMNGTLRETEVIRCTNCGATNHKSWQCPDKPNITHSIVCSKCGSGGHLASDCRVTGPYPSLLSAPGPSGRAKIDAEYMSLMAELGETTSSEPSGANSSTGYGQNLVNYTGQSMLNSVSNATPLALPSTGERTESATSSSYMSGPPTESGSKMPPPLIPPSGIRSPFIAVPPPFSGGHSNSKLEASFSNNSFENNNSSMQHGSGSADTMMTGNGRLRNTNDQWSNAIPLAPVPPCPSTMSSVGSNFSQHQSPIQGVMAGFNQTSATWNTNKHYNSFQPHRNQPRFSGPFPPHRFKPYPSQYGNQSHQYRHHPPQYGQDRRYGQDSRFSHDRRFGQDSQYSQNRSYSQDPQYQDSYYSQDSQYFQGMGYSDDQQYSQDGGYLQDQKYSQGYAHDSYYSQEGYYSHEQNSTQDGSDGVDANSTQQGAQNNCNNYSQQFTYSTDNANNAADLFAAPPPPPPPPPASSSL